TPGYWGYEGNAYLWHAGYWGPHVGFYGGVDYGFGYGGVGFVGGRWDHGHFFYNTAVSRVNVTVVHNVYHTEVVHRDVSRVSFNGPGGRNFRPTAEQERFDHERHFERTSVQMQHEHMASTRPDNFASHNHGRPPAPAMSRPMSRPTNAHNVPRPGNQHSNMRPMQGPHNTNVPANGGFRGNANAGHPNYSPHNMAPHNEAPHNEAPHNEAPHNMARHNEAPHNMAPHNEAPHNQPHNMAPHNEPAHNGGGHPSGGQHEPEHKGHHEIGIAHANGWLHASRFYFEESATFALGLTQYSLGKLALVKIGVKPAMFQKLGVSAAFNDAPLLHHQYLVSLENGGKAMRNYDGSPSRESDLKGALNRGF